MRTPDYVNYRKKPHELLERLDDRDSAEASVSIRITAEAVFPRDRVALCPYRSVGWYLPTGNLRGPYGHQVQRLADSYVVVDRLVTVVGGLAIPQKVTRHAKRPFAVRPIPSHLVLTKVLLSSGVYEKGAHLSMLSSC